MPYLPSFSELRAFEAAARLGSFSFACRELHLTPSVISHQALKTLREECSCADSRLRKTPTQASVTG